MRNFKDKMEKKRKSLLTYGLILFLGGMGGCTLQPPPEPDVFKGNGQVKPTQRPYVIKGRDYYPQDHYEYDQIGISSWYGPGFHGKKTSTGAYFDTNKLTAAHNTLPLPCVVRVTNLENGRVIEVEVNDRGPFAGDRLIDLSRRAAQMLGFINKGLAQVRVECLAEESRALNHLRRQEQAQERARKKGKKGGEKKATPLPGKEKHKIQGTLDPHFSLQKVVQKKAEPVSSSLPLKASSKSSSPKKGEKKATSLIMEVARCKTSGEAKKRAESLMKFGRPRITQVRTSSQSFYRITFGPLKTIKEAHTMVKKFKSKYPSEKNIQICEIPSS